MHISLSSLLSSKWYLYIYNSYANCDLTPSEAAIRAIFVFTYHDIIAFTWHYPPLLFHWDFFEGYRSDQPTEKDLAA